MSFSQIISSLFELFLVVFAIWAVFNEQMFVDFERRIRASFKRRKFKVLRSYTETIR